MVSQMQRIAVLLALGLTLVASQPFQPGQNLAPLGVYAVYTRHHWACLHACTKFL